MSASDGAPPRGGVIGRLWRFLWRPSAAISLGVLLIVGFFGGILFWGAFHWAVEISNTETFCISCHEMESGPYQDLQRTVHFVNRTGVRATCSDCHVPKQWVYKIARKIKATRELYYHFTGAIDTPEKFDAQRLTMAVSVWSSMKATDSRECRNCHEKVWMDTSAQFSRAARSHELALESGALTCVDCHQGIAHRLPEGFERPEPEALVADADAWLAALRARAEAGE